MIQGLRIVLILAMLLRLAACQTFQYSHGWTNGKRAETSRLSSALSSVGRINDFEEKCINFQKWKVLARFNNNQQVCRVPCEFVDVLRQSLRQDKASASDLTDFRALSAPALEASNTY